MSGVKIIPQLKLTDQKKSFYSELEDIHIFRCEIRNRLSEKSDYKCIHLFKSILNLAIQEVLDKKTTKLDKVTKLQHKIKETDGNFKKKLQETVLKDVREMNLTNFVSEIAQIIVDCSISQNNLKYFIELCSIMHQTYPKFAQDLIESMKRHIKQIDQKQGLIENESGRATKRKHLIRFLCELQTVGLLIDFHQDFIEIIKQLIMSPCIYVPDSKEKEKDKEWMDNLLNNLKVGLTFLKYFSYELFGTLSYQEQQDLKEFPQLDTIYRRNNLLPPPIKNQIEQFITDQYLQILKKNIKFLYARIEDQIIQTVSEFGEDQRLKELKDQFSKTKEIYKSACDHLNLFDPNVQPIEEEDQKIFDLNRNDFKEIEGIDYGDPFESQFEKELYLNLPDSKDLLVKPKTQDDNVADDFFKSLRECNSIQAADKLSSDFLGISNKKNRRALIEELVQYRTFSGQIAQFQSRIVAIISRGQKDLEEECTKYLIEQYKSVKVGDNYVLDKRQRILRYLCELTKFKVIRQDVILDFVQLYLDDLVGNNIELLVCLIENCGKFLLRSQEAFRKFKYQLEQLSKLRVTRPLPPQLDIQLENALQSLNPNTQVNTKPFSQKSTLQKYIKFLLFDKLNSETFKQVQEELLRLPFKTSECHRFVYKYLVKLAVKGRFLNLDLGAGLLSVIKRHYPTLVGQVVDHLLEEMLIGLEDNQMGLRQKRVTIVKFLGELYNYDIIQKDLLFSMLYLFLDFKHESDVPKHIQDLIDPPDDTFRITQALTLVESVKEFYKKLRQELIRYLVFFQRYVLSKAYVPQTIEFIILDLYESIDPNLKNIRTLKQAEQLCIKFLEMEEDNKVNYEQELKSMFGEVKQVQENQAVIIEKRRLEQEEKERDEERKQAYEIEQQYNKIINESQNEARIKKTPTQQKKIVVGKTVLKSTGCRIIQRDAGNNGKGQKKKPQENLMMFTNFNATN